LPEIEDEFPDNDDSDGFGAMIPPDLEDIDEMELFEDN
jgi:hypothetical protein